MNKIKKEFEDYKKGIKAITQYIITSTGMESPEHIERSLEDAVDKIVKDLILYKVNHHLEKFYIENPYINHCKEFFVEKLEKEGFEVKIIKD
jgi:hypothetical protein